MPQKTIKYFMLFWSGLSIFLSQAQSTLNIKQNSGINAQYMLTNVHKITFSTGTMSVYQKDATTTYTLSAIQSLSFNQGISALNELKDNTASKLTLYPNPAPEQLTVSFESEAIENGQLQILDLQGRLYLQQNLKCQIGTNLYNVSVSELPKGLYICRLINSKTIATTKFIKF